MDTGFYSRTGSYPPEVRCEMLAELGYDATYLTLWSERAWADLPELGAMAARHGLAVAAVNVTVDVDAPLGSPDTARILGLIRALAGTRTVEISLRHERPGLARSDPAGDGDALRFLSAALEAAGDNDIRLLLYPHTFYWLERVDDAARLCAKLANPRLGLVFPAFHWYAVDGADLSGTLRAAAPFLGLVNLCGSRRLAGQYFPATIEPLDSGDFDNFALLGALRSLPYQGMVGIQGYGVGGDAYEHFRRSLAALRAMEGRLDAHPHWATLRPDHI
jgi:sugar phosphate isomerase/epimerase